MYFPKMLSGILRYSCLDCDWFCEVLVRSTDWKECPNCKSKRINVKDTGGL